jgi:hypothetical protein
MANNNLITHYFFKGMSADNSPNAEEKQSFEYALNGRLHSDNGTISYTSINGTIEVFKNSDIVKVLGYASFTDEVVLLTKVNSKLSNNTGEIIGYKEIKKISAKTIELSSSNPSSSFNVNFNNYIDEITYSIPIYKDNRDDLTINNPISCTDSNGDEINYNDYFREVLNYDKIEYCQINDNNISYEYNKEYLDAFVSIKKDENGNFYHKFLWVGLLNWDINGKIITHTVVENNNYKRIYFSDDQNPFRVINLKDPDLNYRTSFEFESFQRGVLLQPIIESIGDKGMLSSGVNIYAYRLKTANGQQTVFSSYSDEVLIYPDREVFEGGKVNESTSKSVDIKLNLKNHQEFDEVQLIALEFHSYGQPHYIRNIGTKKVAEIVRFTHYGNEPVFDSDLSLSEILNRESNWKYCSDIKSKANKMIAAGLRNNPVNTIVSDMKLDFTLHGWDADGLSHNCLYNPNPKKYRYINPKVEDREWYTVKKRIYTSIQVFGDFTATLNTPYGDITKSFSSQGNYYQEFLNEISNWLIESTSRMTLKVEMIEGKMIWSLRDSSYRMSDYKLVFNTEQYIPQYEDEFDLNNLDAPGTMVYGAQSLGFTKGNGIRITFNVEDEEIMTKATQPFKESKPLFNMRNPSLKKGFMKGETYRIGLLPYDSKGEEMFVIPLGDIYVPALGDKILRIDDFGNLISNQEIYRNSYVINNKMYLQRITLKVEVRMSCDLQKAISMYKLVYVERTGSNRTILAQGISAPLERIQQWDRTDRVNLPEKVTNKWRLPQQGGPLYDKKGLELYDVKPAGPYESSWTERVVTNRKLFYFDSPDFVYDTEDSNLISICKVKRVGRLNIEPNKHIKNNYSSITWVEFDTEAYPSFSRKVYYDQLEGEEDRKPMCVDINVFIERAGDNAELNINHSEALQIGEIIPGYNFGENFEISNNAFTTQYPSWYWNSYGRKEDHCKNGEEKSGLLKSSNYSPGRKTIIIKTAENAFSDSFINQTPIVPVFVDRDRTSPGDMLGGYDTHGLFNLILNNDENVYGGRSERAFASNIYVSLSDTIPLNQESNATQVFDVNGDVYTTLFFRNKNMYHSESIYKNFSIRNGGNCGEIGDDIGVARNGAWCYVVAVESKAEPRLDYTNSFYKHNEKLDFRSPVLEDINKAYFQTKGINSYIPTPYKFKDDPDMGNIIAVSETKLYGEEIDSYLVFKTNNFYELEKEKGKVYNLASDLNNVYAIQEHQTSRLFIDENTMMDTSNGQISIQQGTGQGVSNHQVISDYGTSIRRSVVSPVSSTSIVEGFSFFDERKKEFVRVNIPKLFEQNLSIDFRNRFPNKIIDVEGWFDDKYKETNLRLKFDDGSGIAISYNEKIKCFNGYMNYNEDLYINWNNDLYIPYQKEEYTFLDKLNVGSPMNIRGNKYNLKMKVTSTFDGITTLIFPDSKIITNVNYPIKSVNLNTDFSGTKTINGTHHRYKIQEGVHSFPLKNRTERSDTRGVWLEYDLEVESKNDSKVSIYSITNFVRNSYQ